MGSGEAACGWRHFRCCWPSSLLLPLEGIVCRRAQRRPSSGVPAMARSGEATRGRCHCAAIGPLPCSFWGRSRRGTGIQAAPRVLEETSWSCRIGGRRRGSIEREKRSSFLLSLLPPTSWLFSRGGSPTAFMAVG